jgi:hypothetical protein
MSTLRKTPARAYWGVQHRCRIGDVVFIPGDTVPEGPPEVQPLMRRLVAQGHLRATNEAARHLVRLWGQGIQEQLGHPEPVRAA